MDTALTVMSKFQTKIEALDEHDASAGYAQDIATSSNGFVSRWYANADGSLGDNVSATLRADKDPVHQGVVISEMKGYMPNRTASYNLGYMELTSVKDDGSGENKIKADISGLYLRENNDFVNDNDIVSLTKATEGKRSALTFKLDENNKGSGEVNGLANGKISDDSTQAINGSQLKSFADKIGLVIDSTNNTVKTPELVAIRDQQKPKTVVEATNQLATEVNKGMKFGADAGTETTKYFGDTLSIKSGTLTDTSFVGDNLKTEVKDNNIIIGMKDNPTFKNVTLNRDQNAQIGDNDILTNAETKQIAADIAKSAVKVEGDGDKIIVSSTTDNATGSLTYKVKFNDNFNQTVANKVDVQDFNNYAKSVDSRFDKVDDDIKGTAALAAAMSALSPLDYDPMERTQIMAGVGYYKDNTGLALGVAHHKNNDLMIRGAVAYNHKANAMFNAGISYRFGHKGDIAELNDQDALIVLKRRVQEQNSQLVSQSKQLEQQKEQLAEQNKQIQELTALVQGLLKK